TFDVVLPENEDVKAYQSPPLAFKFKIMKVKEINMVELNRWLEGKSKISNDILKAINVLSVLSRHGPLLDQNFTSIGRTLYTSENSQAIVGGAEGQHYMERLDEKQTAQMVKYATEYRAHKINQGINLLNYHENKQMQEFRIGVSNKMVVTPARVLPAPVINYHVSSKESSITPRDGSWNMQDKKVANGVTLGSWSVISFRSGRDLPPIIIQRFIRELVSTCSDAEMNIIDINPPVTYADTSEESVRQAFIRAEQSSKQKTQLIL
ncbi:275_t:CDS:2, partial [Acaulospora colombiana]